MNNISWEELMTKSKSEQVELVNKVIKSNQEMNVSDISKDVFKQPKARLSQYMTELGYRYVGKQYVEKTEKSNQKITQDYIGNREYDRVDRSNNENTLHVFSVVQEVLNNTNNKETTRATVKMSKDTEEKLTEFLEEHSLLKKQDVIGVAVELFLSKFYK